MYGGYRRSYRRRSYGYRAKVNRRFSYRRRRY